MKSLIQHKIMLKKNKWKLTETSTNYILEEQIEGKPKRIEILQWSDKE